MNIDHFPIIRFRIENGSVLDLSVSPAYELEPDDKAFLENTFRRMSQHILNYDYASAWLLRRDFLLRGLIPFISELHDDFERAYVREFGLETAQEIVEQTARAGYFATSGGKSGVHLDKLTKSKETNKRNGMSSVLINAMPRSASTFISELFRLKYEGPTRVFKIGVGEFPSYRLIPSKVSFMNGGGVFCKDHFMPTAENLDVLRNSGFSRVFVMLRDPRQALLSWAHEGHNQFCKASTPIRTIDYIDTEDFCGADLGKRIDLLIESYYPALITFADQWTKSSEGGGMPDVTVKIGEFSTVKEDVVKYMDEIATFFDLPAEVTDHLRRYKSIEIRQGDKLLFRKGEPNEWMEVFTPDQIARTTKEIPEYLIEKYGWARV